MTRPDLGGLVSAARQFGLASLASCVVCVVALATYDRRVLRPAMTVGVVDIAEVYRAKEAEFALLLTRASADEDREKALAMARAFARRLPIALEELHKECGCLVLVKSAVAGAPHPRDLTPLLRQKVQ